MATVSKLLALLNGLPTNTDLTTSDLVTNSVWVGGTTSSPSIQVTPTLLNSFLTSVTAGSGISVTGSAPSQTVAVDSTVVRTNGANAFTADQSMGSHKLTNVTDPVSAQDAATKNYVDTHSGTAITSLTGDVTATGPGAAAATVAQIQGTTVSGTTGTGNVMFSASPTTTGTLTAAAISASGNISSSGGTVSGTNLTTGGHASADLALAGGTMTGAIAMSSNKITGLADPTLAQDAATKNYVDTLAQGIAWKNPVRAVSTTNITLSAPQTVDGVSLLAGDRVLVAGQTTVANNGIYVVAAGAWSRSADATTGAELVAAAVFVDEGTVSAATAWVQTTAAPITVGSTSIVWSKFASATPYNFRNGLTQTGQIIDVVAGDNSLTSTPGSLVVKLNAAGAISTTGTGLQVNTDSSTTQITSDNVAVKLDTGATTGNIVSSGSGLKNTLESSNPTLQISSNALGVKLDGARAITTGASGIGVNVDNSTIDISGNAIEVKSAGITATQLASASVTAAKLGSVTDGITTDQNGSGSTIEVLQAPKLATSQVAGTSFSTTTSYVVRFALTGETVGRIYLADAASAATNGKYLGFGVMSNTGAVVAGNTVTVVTEGTYTLAASDSAFASGDIGKAVYLKDDASGGFSTTAPSTSGSAAYRIGIVKTTTSMWLGTWQLNGIN